MKSLEVSALLLPLFGIDIWNWFQLVKSLDKGETIFIHIPFESFKMLNFFFPHKPSAVIKKLFLYKHFGYCLSSSKNDTALFFPVW